MMPAVKHLDPVLGVDIHLIITPPGAVVPIPHPHIGMVFDPFDYLPIIGSTVNVNGLPRAQAGTGGIALPPHFPIGGTFLKPPGNDNETFMGSSTVLVDEEPFTHMLLPVLSCQDIGMPRPPRKKSKGGAKSLLLPTTVALSIPAGPPVFVGGPPTISMAGLAQQLALGALFKGLKKLRKLQKASRKMKALSDRLHRAAKKVMDKLKVGPRARNRVHKALCTLTGHPVDVVTGRVVTDVVDWALPGPLPLRFERHYSSAWGGRDSVMGRGWNHSLDLVVWEEDGRVVYRAEDGREIEFDTSALSRQRMPLGAELYEPIDRMTLRRTGEVRWEVEAADGLVHELRQVRAGGPCQVVRTRSRAGHAIVYEYDARGLLEWVVDSAGRRLRFEHDARGRLVRTWLPHPTQPGLVPHDRYVYSEAGELVEAYDALGHARRYAYEHQLLVRETDRTGLSFHFEYDGQGPEAWCVRTWGDGGIYDHRLRYDKKGGITQVTNSLGDTTTYHSDGRGVVVKVVDPAGGELQYEYDEALRKRSEVEPQGTATSYSYDERGNCTKVVRPDGAAVTIEYNRFNLPERAIDVMGGEWRWSYDTSGRLVETVNPLQERNGYEYAGGLLSAITDARGERKVLTYDEHKNLSFVRSSAGVEVRLGHDRLGRQNYRRNARGAEWRTRHDALGREIRVEGPTGAVFETRFDAEGNVLEVRSPLRQVRYGYTGFHWLAWKEEASARVSLQYDTEGRLVSFKNEAGELHGFELDERGLVKRQVGYDGSAREYQYDLAGNLLRITHPSARTEDFAYDELGRLKEVRYSDGTFRRFGYRPDGMLVLAENESGTVELERDALGRITSESQRAGQVLSQYSSGGDRSEVRSSLGARQSILRNVLGDVTDIVYASESSPEPWKASFERDRGGFSVARHFPGGVVSTWRHDAVGCPVELRTLVQGQQQRSRTYQWRGHEQVAAILDDAHGSVEYLHDVRGRLIGARSPEGGLQHRAMDAMGNLFQRPERGDRRYGRGGRPEELDGARYVYDADGHLIEVHRPRQGVWRYSWNGAGLLREVERPDGARVRFDYDALARRTRKSVVRMAGEGVEALEREVSFVWDRHVILHEVSSSEGTSTWLFEPELFKPLAKEDRTGRYSVVTDHLGTPMEMYDEAGRLAWQMQLDLFGAARTDTASQVCPWRWPGQYADEETGLYYNRYRYYDPRSGCYISQDPLGIQGGINLYAYVEDPLWSMDPLGLNKCDPKVLEAAVSDATKRIPGLGEKQARLIFEQAFSRNSSVVFGGSRVRGNFKPTSDLDVGFGSLSSAQAGKVLKKADEVPGGLPIEKTIIVPGNQTKNIPKIESPEEFFMRSGARSDPGREGELFSPSGYVSYSPTGSIQHMSADGVSTVISP